MIKLEKMSYFIVRLIAKDQDFKWNSWCDRIKTLSLLVSPRLLIKCVSCNIAFGKFHSEMQCNVIAGRNIRTALQINVKSIETYFIIPYGIYSKINDNIIELPLSC